MLTRYACLINQGAIYRRDLNCTLTPSSLGWRILANQRKRSEYDCATFEPPGRTRAKQCMIGWNTIWVGCFSRNTFSAGAILQEDLSKKRNTLIRNPRGKRKASASDARHIQDAMANSITRPTKWVRIGAPPGHGKAQGFSTRLPAAHSLRNSGTIRGRRMKWAGYEPR